MRHDLHSDQFVLTVALPRLLGRVNTNDYGLSASFKGPNKAS